MPNELITLSNGITSEWLPIETANPLNFYQAISQPDAMQSVQINGHLFLPAGKGPWPTVIVVPGSLGISDNNIRATELLADREIAVCLIDPFGGRDVSSTVANQTQYTFAASAWDVLATTKALQTLPDVDSTRLGTQGHSRGGAAVLSAACMAQIVNGIDPNNFLGVLAVYPWCGQQFLYPRVGKTVVRAVIGDLDEWCLPQQVQAYLHAMKLVGGDADWRIFANAHHSFDRDVPLAKIEDAAVSPGAPTIYLEDNGAMIHPTKGESDPYLTERELMIYALKSGYGRKGARIGTLGNEAQLFREYMTDFWGTVFSS